MSDFGRATGSYVSAIQCFDEVLHILHQLLGLLHRREVTTLGVFSNRRRKITSHALTDVWDRCQIMFPVVFAHAIGIGPSSIGKYEYPMGFLTW